MKKSASRRILRRERGIIGELNFSDSPILASDSKGVFLSLIILYIMIDKMSIKFKYSISNLKYQNNNSKRKIFNFCFAFFIFLFFISDSIFASVSIQNDVSISAQSGQNMIFNNSDQKEQKIKQGISKAITQIQTTVNGKTIEDLKLESNGADKKISKSFKDKNISAKTNVLIKKENLAIKKIEIPLIKTPQKNSFWQWLLKIFSI